LKAVARQAAWGARTDPTAAATAATDAVAAAQIRATVPTVWAAEAILVLKPRFMDGPFWPRAIRRFVCRKNRIWHDSCGNLAAQLKQVLEFNGLP
jgi:hypothetical protein